MMCRIIKFLNQTCYLYLLKKELRLKNIVVILGIGIDLDLKENHRPSYYRDPATFLKVDTMNLEQSHSCLEETKSENGKVRQRIVYLYFLV